jgi:hypothetical protein
MSLLPNGPDNLSKKQLFFGQFSVLRQIGLLLFCQMYRSDRDFLLRFGGWLGPSETTIYSQFV